jgi:4-carboxymuconolactone decarboxylase
VTDHDARDARARGAEVYRAVYGDDATVFDEGAADFFDLMISHLFGEVWARPALSIAERRLLEMGVVAAQHHFDILGRQFARALETGELTPAQVREAVIHLIPYVGYPSSGDLYRVGEDAIAAHDDTRTDDIPSAPTGPAD